MSAAPQKANETANKTSKKKETAEERFDRYVPARFQEDVMEMIVEAAYEQPDDLGDGIEIDGVRLQLTYIDTVQRNVTTVEAEGVFEIGGVEHTFHILSGDANGTELRGWNDDSEIDRTPRSPDVLVPHRTRVSDAICYGRAKEFLEEWDRDLLPGTERGNVLHDLLSKRAYDIFFDPRPSAYRYDKIADKHGYSVGEGPEETMVRTILHLNATTLMPLPEFLEDKRPLEALRKWNEALIASTDAVAEAEGRGTEIFRVRRDAAKALAEAPPAPHSGLRSTTPRPEDEEQMRKLGFRFADVREPYALRLELLMDSYRLEHVRDVPEKDLPDNSALELFRVMDPSRVPSTKVDPLKHASERMVQTFDRMAKGTDIKLPDDLHKTIEDLGFKIITIGDTPQVEPEPDVEPEEDCAPGL